MHSDEPSLSNSVIQDAHQGNVDVKSAALPSLTLADGPVTLVLTGASKDEIAVSAGTLASRLPDGADLIAVWECVHDLIPSWQPGQSRAAIVARNGPEMLAGLRALAEGAPAPGVVAGCGPRGGPVWVFSGQGSQRPGMGLALLREEPIFRLAVDDLDGLFLSEAGFSLRKVLASSVEFEGINVVQPALFGLQMALAQLWAGYGVTPAAVIGHSMGEIAAAVVAGALTLTDGLRIVVRRSCLLRTIAGCGQMAAICLSAEESAPVIRLFPSLDIAVHASQSWMVLAGPAPDVNELLIWADKEEIPAYEVAVDVASHSRQVEPLLGSLRVRLDGIRATAPSIPFYSTVTPQGAAPPNLGPDYWCANLRQPVRFTEAVSAALQDGYDLFTEISPHPVLLSAIEDTRPDYFKVTMPTLRRDSDEALDFHTALATLEVNNDTRQPNNRYISGAAMSWKRRRDAPAARLGN